MSKAMLEKLVFLAALLILPLAGWFWAGQIQDVVELLRMAYG